MTHHTLLLIGCGTMGSAMLSRWLSKPDSPIHRYVLVEPNALPFSADGLTHVKALSDLPADCAPDIILLAVKPQTMESLLPDIAKRFGTAPTYLSIAAGKTLGFYASYLGQGASIVRAMPNMPATIGEGITALVGNSALTPQGKKLATELMQAVGEIVWLNDEAEMDAITAISGSGPAYLFYFMSCMVEAAVKHGIDAKMAEKLVRHTALGAAKLAMSSEKGLCDLTAAVTSKGGTTEAALEIFEHNHALNTIINAAIEAAIKRSKTLS